MQVPPFPTLLSYSSWSLTSDPWKIKVKLGICWGLQNTTNQKDTTQSVFMCVILKNWKYTVYIQVFLDINQFNVSCTWRMCVVKRVVKGCSLSEWQKRAAESALHTSVWNVCVRNEMCWLILCFGILRNTTNCFIRSHRNRKSAPKTHISQSPSVKQFLTTVFRFPSVRIDLSLLLTLTAHSGTIV